MLAVSDLSQVLGKMGGHRLPNPSTHLAWNKNPQPLSLVSCLVLETMCEPGLWPGQLPPRTAVPQRWDAMFSRVA